LPTFALGMRAAPVHVTESDRRALKGWIRAGTTPQRVVKRARIVLCAADGLSLRTIARTLDTSQRTVMLWRRRYQENGPDTLWRDAAGRGRKSTITTDVISRVRALLATEPPEGGSWSIRRLAQHTGLSRSAVHRIALGSAQTLRS
jgi:transposase